MCVAVGEVGVGVVRCGWVGWGRGELCGVRWGGGVGGGVGVCGVR